MNCTVRSEYVQRVHLEDLGKMTEVTTRPWELIPHPPLLGSCSL